MGGPPSFDSEQHWRQQAILGPGNRPYCHRQHGSNADGTGLNASIRIARHPSRTFRGCAASAREDPHVLPGRGSACRAIGSALWGSSGIGGLRGVASLRCLKLVEVKFELSSSWFCIDSKAGFAPASPGQVALRFAQTRAQRTAVTDWSTEDIHTLFHRSY
jgi:hypothetical protein